MAALGRRCLALLAGSHSKRDFDRGGNRKLLGQHELGVLCKMIRRRGVGDKIGIEFRSVSLERVIHIRLVVYFCDRETQACEPSLIAKWVSSQ